MPAGLSTRSGVRPRRGSAGGHRTARAQVGARFGRGAERGPFPQHLARRARRATGELDLVVLDSSRAWSATATCALGEEEVEPASPPRRCRRRAAAASATGRGSCDAERKLARSRVEAAAQASGRPAARRRCARKRRCHVLARRSPEEVTRFDGPRTTTVSSGRPSRGRRRPRCARLDALWVGPALRARRGRLGRASATRHRRASAQQLRDAARSNAPRRRRRTDPRARPAAKGGARPQGVRGTRAARATTTWPGDVQEGTSSCAARRTASTSSGSTAKDVTSVVSRARRRAAGRQKRWAPLGPGEARELPVRLAITSTSRDAARLVVGNDEEGMRLDLFSQALHVAVADQARGADPGRPGRARRSRGAPVAQGACGGTVLVQAAAAEGATPTCAARGSAAACRSSRRTKHLIAVDKPAGIPVHPGGRCWRTRSSTRLRASGSGAVTPSSATASTSRRAASCWSPRATRSRRDGPPDAAARDG